MSEGTEFAGPGARICHSGPEQTERFAAVPCRTQPLRLVLNAGWPLHEAIVMAVKGAGYEAAYLRINEVDVKSLDYVIPAPAPGNGRAAWYSETHAFESARIHTAGLHLGVKSGAPFIHCHGIWSDVYGRRAMGHLLPGKYILTAETTIKGWGLSGAILKVKDDAETGFPLFAAIATGDAGRDGSRGLLCTLRPNSDICTMVQRIAREHGMGSCAVDGIGSLVGTTFENGQRVTSYATEVLVTSGNACGSQASISVASVGFDGAFRLGPLRPGVNNVCVTCELLFRTVSGQGAVSWALSEESD